MLTVKRRPRRRMTRCSPWRLTMPPSSTPACCTLVIDSPAEAASAILAAGAADIDMAPMPESADGLGAWLRASERERRWYSSAQRLNRSEISRSLANACSVLLGAACEGCEAQPVRMKIVATVAATALRRNRCSRMAHLLCRYRVCQGWLREAVIKSIKIKYLNNISALQRLGSPTINGRKTAAGLTRQTGKGRDKRKRAAARPLPVLVAERSYFFFLEGAAATFAPPSAAKQ